MKEGQKKTHREWLTALIWLIVTLTVYAVSVIVLEDWTRYLFILPLALIFYLLRLAILLPLSKKERGRGNRLARRVIYLALCVALLAGAVLWRDSYGLPLYPYLTVGTSPFEPQNIASIEHEEDGVITLRFIFLETMRTHTRTLEAGSPWFRRAGR